MKLPFYYTTDTTVGDVMKDPRAWEIAKPLVSKNIFGGGEDAGSDAASEAISDEMTMAMMEYMPLRGPVSFQGGVSMADVQEIVDKLNALE